MLQLPTTAELLTGVFLSLAALLAHGMPGVAPATAAQDRPTSQLNAERWRVRCVTGNSGQVLLDTTFVGRVKMRPGGILWQVSRETITRFDAGAGDRGKLGRRNYATADCLASAVPAGSDLIPRFNRPGRKAPAPRPTKRSREGGSDTTYQQDPRKEIPDEVLPDSMMRDAAPEGSDGRSLDTTETVMQEDSGRRDQVNR